MKDIGARLTKSAAKAEALSTRARAHHARLLKAAAAMAEHANTAAAGLRAKAEAGDANAMDAYRRAVYGRARGRRLAAE